MIMSTWVHECGMCFCDGSIRYAFAGGQQLTQAMTGGLLDRPWIGHLVQAQQLNDDNDVVGTYDAVLLQHSPAAILGTIVGHAIDIYVDTPPANGNTQVGLE